MPPCMSGQLEKDLGLEVSSVKHAARLIIFEIMVWIELKPSWRIAFTAYCQSRPWSCADWETGPVEGKRRDFTRSRNDSVAEYFDCRKMSGTLPRSSSVWTDRADRRTNRFSANEKAVASRDHTARSFASFRIIAKRLVVDALLNLEGTDRFGGVGGFVNVSRHRDNVLVNGLGAFPFGKTFRPGLFSR